MLAGWRGVSIWRFKFGFRMRHELKLNRPTVRTARSGNTIRQWKRRKGTNDSETLCSAGVGIQVRGATQHTTIPLRWRNRCSSNKKPATIRSSLEELNTRVPYQYSSLGAATEQLKYPGTCVLCLACKHGKLSSTTKHGKLFGEVETDWSGRAEREGKRFGASQ